MLLPRSRAAPDNWGGPSSKTWLRGVLSYIQVCCEAHIPLKLTKCLGKVLLLINDLKPAHKQQVLQSIKTTMFADGGERAVALAAQAQAPAALPAPPVPLALPAPEAAGAVQRRSRASGILGCTGLWWHQPIWPSILWWKCGGAGRTASLQRPMRAGLTDSLA